MTEELTHEKLLSLIHYDINTGLFTWIKPPNRRIVVGSVAGTLSNLGYILIKLLGKQYKAHRLAIFYITGRMPNNFVDHVDRNPLNNTYLNLRECTSSQNQFNTAASLANKSGYKGVHWSKKDCRWVASSRINGVRKHLGNFKTLEEAALAYKTFAENNHGDFINYTAILKG